MANFLVLNLRDPWLLQPLTASPLSLRRLDDNLRPGSRFEVMPEDRKVGILCHVELQLVEGQAIQQGI